MNELLELNQRLSYIQGEFVNEVIKKTYRWPRAFLEKHEITDLNEIIFLQKYLRHVFKQFRKVWMEEDYENHFEAREINKRNFRKHDQELTQIIKTKRSQL